MNKQHRELQLWRPGFVSCGVKGRGNMTGGP